MCKDKTNRRVGRADAWEDMHSDMSGKYSDIVAGETDPTSGDFAALIKTLPKYNGTPTNGGIAGGLIKPVVTEELKKLSEADMLIAKTKKEIRNNHFIIGFASAVTAICIFKILLK